MMVLHFVALFAQLALCVLDRPVDRVIHVFRFICRSDTDMVGRLDNHLARIVPVLHIKDDVYRFDPRKDSQTPLNFFVDVKTRVRFPDSLVVCFFVFLASGTFDLDLL